MVVESVVSIKRFRIHTKDNRGFLIFSSVNRMKNELRYGMLKLQRFHTNIEFLCNNANI